MVPFAGEVILAEGGLPCAAHSVGVQSVAASSPVHIVSTLGLRILIFSAVGPWISGLGSTYVRRANAQRAETATGLSYVVSGFSRTVACKTWRAQKAIR